MAGQGSPTIAINNLPITCGVDSITQRFQDFEGFIQVRVITLPETFKVAFIEFATSVDATRALNARESVRIEGRTYVPQYADDNESSLQQDLETPVRARARARKRQKISHPDPKKLCCLICTTDIDTDAYSKPCRKCQQPWCHECIRTMFRLATNDNERMPARCCRRVLHYGVAVNILTRAELEVYKSKFEQFCIANPLYCPVPTCSTFISPRLQQPIPNEKNKVACIACPAIICTDCKQLATPDLDSDQHTCTPLVSTDIAKFNYKTCPKCNTGVIKMYGCPHVRCVGCGAHWCYDCRRPIDACYRRPCRASREDGNYDEDYDGHMSDGSDTEEEIVQDNGGNGDADQAVAPGTVPANDTMSLASLDAEVASPVPDPTTTLSPSGINHEVPPSAAEPADLLISNDTLPAIVLFDTAPEDRTVTPTGTSPQPLPDQDIAPAADPGTVFPPLRDIYECPATPIEVPVTDVATGTTLPTLAQVFGDDLARVTGQATPPARTNTPEPVPAPATVSAGQQPQNDEEVNLDDPDDHDWEGDNLSLGGEPEDEAWDVWGCQHVLSEIKDELVHEKWMGNINVVECGVDCLMCFENVKVQKKEVEEEIQSKGENTKDDTAAFTILPTKQKPKQKKDKDQGAWECHYCGIITCGKCRGDVRRQKRADARRVGRGEV